MTFGKEGKKPTDTLKWPGASEEDSTLGILGQSIIRAQVMIGEIKPKDNSIAPNHQGRNKVVEEPPELFQLKCVSPTLKARPHLNRNKTSVPRI
jgi:hypothetical protein